MSNYKEPLRCGPCHVAIPLMPYGDVSHQEMRLLRERDREWMRAIEEANEYYLDDDIKETQHDK